LPPYRGSAVSFERKHGIRWYLLPAKAFSRPWWLSPTGVRGRGFSEVRVEAVWKVVLGGYFATLARIRKPYPTDLSDEERNYIEPHMPAPIRFGRPRTHDLREILNAVFYVLKSGCQWPLLPHDFPR
jgi:hypothetical protein